MFVPASTLMFSVTYAFVLSLHKPRLWVIPLLAKTTVKPYWYTIQAHNSQAAESSYNLNSWVFQDQLYVIFSWQILKKGYRPPGKHKGGGDFSERLLQKDLQHHTQISWMLCHQCRHEQEALVPSNWGDSVFCLFYLSPASGFGAALHAPLSIPVSNIVCQKAWTYHGCLMFCYFVTTVSDLMSAVFCCTLSGALTILLGYDIYGSQYQF